MEIIEYQPSYLESVKDLLTELEEYLVLLDQDELEYLHPDYHEKMAIFDLKAVEKDEGKCFLAIENQKVIGLVMGVIPPYTEQDYLDYKCPKRGVITELVVTSNIRSRGVGKALIQEMEQYFKKQNCEYVLVDVFAYNSRANQFYEKSGYHTRMYTKIKKIDNFHKNS